MSRRRFSGRSNPPCYRRLVAEPLESRQLLTITVNTLVDEADGSITDGDISLRDAIALAPSGETIDFSVNGTILLTLGELVIDKDLTIDGPGAELLTIDASGNDPTPDSTLDDGDDTNDGDGSRVFNIHDEDWHSGFQVVLADLTLTGGDAKGPGGAVLSSDSLEIQRSRIWRNSSQYGGGIALIDISGNGQSRCANRGGTLDD
ncbi:MAG: hypothetical protein R3C10_17570 [Pirellulales bacterium]